MAKKPTTIKTVESLKHDEATRKNIPTAEYQSVMQKNEQSPVRVAYERGVAGLDDAKERRNRDLDPQLVWRGKDEQDWSDLVVHAPPLYIQEKVHPKVLIDDLLKQTREQRAQEVGAQFDLFGDFNGIPEGVDKTEFYQHDQNWSNRMILGDSLQVMASLAEREGLRGKVQCIYFDPPYGIKFNSNFQWSTTSRDVKDGKADHITREPEQVKAFRDTWRDGIHSYLTYLRDRLTVARDLLTDSGSIFVQIGDENVHRVRGVMDEVFGEDNFISQITVRKTTSEGNTLLGATCDFVLWFGKHRDQTRARTLYSGRSEDSEGRYTSEYLDGSLYRFDNVTSSRPAGEGDVTTFRWFNQDFNPGKGTFKTKETGLIRLGKADRFQVTKNGKLNYRRSQNDFGYGAMGNLWADISGAVQSRSDPKVYVVQTSTSIIARCLLLATDPGDLVLDPTCGSGTTATVAEQWGRRWITIDTSRVALALARARIMGARYPFYLLADSREGQIKEAEVTRTVPSSQPVRGKIRHGFVYERVPHITLKSIANNAEIDVIWDKWQANLEPLRKQLNQALVGWAERSEAHQMPANDDGLRSRSAHPTNIFKPFEEWEIPREADPTWPDAAKKLHADWWQARIARQKEIDASIAAKAEFEYLCDKPYTDNKKVRVAGPFTAESLSPHRVLGVDEDDELIDTLKEDSPEYGARQSFPQMILENLKTAGVQQAHKEDRITFTALTPWPGDLVCAEGRYLEGETEKRAAIFIGPEFGTVTRPDLVAAAREAGDADFDVLIACAFNYEAHATEFSKLGRIPVLKARMNADLHMAEDLKNTGKGNLFVIFGEPDITLLTQVQLIIQELKTLVADPALEICTECLLKAEEQLFEQAKVAENNVAQSELIDAVSLIYNNRGRLAPALAEALARKIESLDRSQPSAFPSKATTPLRNANELVLVKHDDFEDFLSLSEAVVRVELRFKDALYRLQRRFSFLSRSEIDRTTNPIGPVALCNLIGDALHNLDFTTRQCQAAYPAVSASLLANLGDFYHRVNECLRKLNVLPNLDGTPAAHQSVQRESPLAPETLARAGVHDACVTQSDPRGTVGRRMHSAVTPPVGEGTLATPSPRNPVGKLLQLRQWMGQDAVGTYPPGGQDPGRQHQGHGGSPTLAGSEPYYNASDLIAALPAVERELTLSAAGAGRARPSRPG